jgi:hypothetical protein
MAMATPVLAIAPDAAVDEATTWLKTQQNADGGFSNGFTPESNLSTTTEAVIAMAAAGQDPGVAASGGASALDYVYGQMQSGGVDGVGLRSRVVLALVSAGLDPANFAGQDLVGQIQAAYEAETGSYGGSIFDQTLAMLALANAGRSVPAGAVDYLMAYQTTDGAWNFQGDTAALSGDTNTTAMAVQALVAAGQKDQTGEALAYLKRVQNDDAGWPYQNPSPYGTETDANSTALVLEAIYAVGQTPGDWYVNGTDPLGPLLALQNDNGSFSFQASFPGDNVLATIQAVPAAAGVTLANLPQVSTAATPGMGAAGGAAGAEPELLPQAGGVIPLARIAGLLIVLGLALVVAGWRLRYTRQTTTG